MDQKNLIVAIVLSLGILLGFQYFYELPRMKAQQAAREAEQAAQVQQGIAPGGNLPQGTRADLPPIPGQTAPGPVIVQTGVPACVEDVMEMATTTNESSRLDFMSRAPVFSALPD